MSTPSWFYQLPCRNWYRRPLDLSNVICYIGVDGAATVIGLKSHNRERETRFSPPSLNRGKAPDLINVIQFRTLPTDDLHSSEWAHLLGLEVQDLETACKNFEGYPNAFAQGDALMLLSRIETLAAAIKTKISQPINCGRCEDDPANWPCIICDR